MEYLTAQQIVDQYKKGRRDFSNINAHGVVITDKKLPGIIFRKANINTGSLRGCDLTGADFTGAKMKWMDLDNCNFTNAVLNKADLSYSRVIKAIFENTKVTDANISYTLMFGVNRGGANFGDTIADKVAWKGSDVTEVSKMEVQKEAERTSMSLDIFMKIQKTVSNLGKALHNIGEKVGSFIGYGKSSSTTYASAGTVYGGKSDYGAKTAYGKESTYTTKMEYGMQKEDEIPGILKKEKKKFAYR